MNFRQSLARSATAIILAGAALTLPASFAHTAAAQSNPVLQNVIPKSEAAVFQAKIEKIDVKTRQIWLVSSSGTALTVVAGPAVRLNLLAPGQIVTATYYRSVAFYVSGPKGGNGTPVSNNAIAQAAARPAQAPGGIAVQVVRISGTVVGLDLAAHRISVVNPSGGGVHTIDVTDPQRIAALSSLKVGDTITAVVSEVLAISVKPASKN